MTPRSTATLLLLSVISAAAEPAVPLVPEVAREIFAEPTQAAELGKALARDLLSSSGTEILLRLTGGSAATESPLVPMNSTPPLVAITKLPIGLGRAIATLQSAVTAAEAITAQPRAVLDGDAVTTVLERRNDLVGLGLDRLPTLSLFSRAASLDLGALPRISTTDLRPFDDRERELISAVLRARETIDLAPAAEALAILEAALDAVTPGLRSAAATASATTAASETCPNPPPPPLFVDQDLAVSVFGAENNCHFDPCPTDGSLPCDPADNARIRIDLGGNDRYFGQTAVAYGNLAATVADSLGEIPVVGTPPAEPSPCGTDQTDPGDGSPIGEIRRNVRLSVDAAGNDLYGDPAALVSHTQGAGLCGGVGVLADLDGDDRYTCDVSCQGYGEIGGAGALIDAAGDDVYTANGFAQGSGILGAGLLSDLAGNDRYRAVATAQGAAAGAGVLFDGGGNDVYLAPVLAQGAGLLGAGVLIDASGDDRYHNGVFLGSREAPFDLPLSTLGQGTGTLGAGILVDGGGDDRYAVGNLVTLLSQGSALIGAGALVDLDGTDLYATDNLAVTALHGLALAGGGLLVDDGEGSDRYAGGVFSIRLPGAGPFSLPSIVELPSLHLGLGQGGAVLGAAILSDGGGDDVYTAAATVNGELVSGPFVQAAVAGAGTAILADRGGNDVYVAGDQCQAFAVSGGLVGGLGPVLESLELPPATAAIEELLASLMGDDTTDSYALLADAAGSDSYTCGIEIDQPGGDCGETTRFYHGYAEGSAYARLRDTGGDADLYRAQIGTTPAANDAEWVRGCDEVRLLGIGSGQPQGGGEDD